ncbi:hypothetical protein KUTeg_009876 [Tegillarca granosa]|uniref:Saposin B-type domain-containing protein n=1 Tax=Tegillarca granosa TaxID=220873 RepID=A0ABQ9F547_TEGGR|nr:hypothetical protein KUTeg_009876 [Tegillarca granosa]
MLLSLYSGHGHVKENSFDEDTYWQIKEIFTYKSVDIRMDILYVKLFVLISLLVTITSSFSYIYSNHSSQSKTNSGENTYLDFVKFRQKHVPKHGSKNHGLYKAECGTLRGIDCTLCKLVVRGLKGLAEKGSTQEEVIKYATEACIRLKIEDKRVCRSITVEFKDELFGVAQGLVLSPEEACGTLIGGNCGTPYDPSYMWNVTIPPGPKPDVTPHTLPKFDYIIFTGDLPPHNIWNQTKMDQITSLQTYTRLMKKYLPDKIIYNTMGNHESAPVNSFPPPTIKGQNMTWLYSAVAESWGLWLPKDTTADIVRGGFYTVLIKPGFRLVSLNMNYCNNGNWWLLINTTDPVGQLQWLVNVLQNAENKKEKVHIIGHIHPGSSDCLKAFSWNYYRIVNRYESTVAGQFFGHAHP